METEARTVEIAGLITRQSTLAVLFSDGIMEEWLPKSQIIEQNPLENGMVELVVPEWLAIERGFV